MTIEEKLDFIVKTINSTDKLSSYDFNVNEDARSVFCLIHNEENLHKQLERELPHNYNKFYTINHSLEVFVESNSVHAPLANAYANKIEDYYKRNWLKIHLVKYAVQQGQIEIAEQITSEIPDEDSGPGQYMAHRHILEYYSKRGDIENFKRKTKASKLGKAPRYGIEGYKGNLLEGYAKANGVVKAFEQIENKFFEKTAAIGILRWTAHLLTLDEIDEYLEKYPRVLNETPTARANLYVLHFREAPDVAISQNEFDRTLNEILKTDKDAKCGDFRCRDALLLDLGFSTLVKEQALECKKHLVSPKAKGDLNRAIKYNEDNKLFIS